LQKARHLWSQGSKVASIEYYQRAVDITPEIANAFVQELKRRNIRFLVAPYEADAQCAYLALNGYVDAVLTEDSDLLCYGCSRVLFKFDGVVADRVQFGDLVHCRELSFVGWDLGMFQQMCVLAGCDFVKALPGIGVKKAHGHMRRTRSVERVIRGLRFDGIKVPKEYAGKVQRALWTFKYQRVYCPRRRCVVNLNEIPELGLESDGFCPEAARLVNGEADFLGKEIEHETARGIAEGRLHPVTWLPFAARGGQEVGRGERRGERGERGERQLTASSSSLMHRVAVNASRIKDVGARKESLDLSRHLSQQHQQQATHVRKPNGQLMVNLQAMKKGLKRALGLGRHDTDGDGNEDEDGYGDADGVEANWRREDARVAMMCPGVTVAGVGPTATGTTKEGEKNKDEEKEAMKRARRRQSVTPSRDNSMLYDDGFDSPAVIGNEGSLFSSKKYREQLNGGSSLHYASVERDAAESTGRIEAFWEASQKSPASKHSKVDPFSLFRH